MWVISTLRLCIQLEAKSCFCPKVNQSMRTSRPGSFSTATLRLYGTAVAALCCAWLWLCILIWRDLGPSGNGTSCLCPGLRPTKASLSAKQSLSHWIDDAITLAYSNSGLQIPTGLRARSTMSFATSWALCFGRYISRISVLQLPDLYPSYLQGFYKLHVTSQSLALAFLSVGSSVDLSLPHTSAWGRLAVSLQDKLV